MRLRFHFGRQPPPDPSQEGIKRLCARRQFPSREGSGVGSSGRPRSFRQSAFTMVEIAIALAVIGFALVAIIGVLPAGMNVQKENREETVINQDASIFLQAIRSGARGLDDLTNYVIAITNNWAEYSTNATQTNWVP